MAIHQQIYIEKFLDLGILKRKFYLYRLNLLFKILIIELNSIISNL